jgi:hypothetical protein
LRGQVRSMTDEAASHAKAAGDLRMSQFQVQSNALRGSCRRSALYASAAVGSSLQTPHARSLIGINLNGWGQDPLTDLRVAGPRESRSPPEGGDDVQPLLAGRRADGEALSDKSRERRPPPFPRQTYPLTSVTGVRSAAKLFRTATRTSNSAT